MLWLKDNIGQYICQKDQFCTYKYHHVISQYVLFGKQNEQQPDLFKKSNRFHVQYDLLLTRNMQACDHGRHMSVVCTSLLTFSIQLCSW